MENANLITAPYSYSTNPNFVFNIKAKRDIVLEFDIFALNQIKKLETRIEKGDIVTISVYPEVRCDVLKVFGLENNETLFIVDVLRRFEGEICCRSPILAKNRDQFSKKILSLNAFTLEK